MKLAIYSIQNTLFRGDAEKVIARTPLGQITVLDNHLPLISILAGPLIEVVGRGGEKTAVAITAGFLEVRPQSEVVILADQ